MGYDIGFDIMMSNFGRARQTRRELIREGARTIYRRAVKRLIRGFGGALLIHITQYTLRVRRSAIA